MTAPCPNLYLDDKIACMYAIFSVLKNPRIFGAIVLLGGGFTLSGLHNTPFFSTPDSFVLFAEDMLTLDPDVQVSSGNLGSNGTLALGKHVLATGDLFAKTITIDKESVLNGNAFFNKLQAHKDAQILGSATKGVELPVVNIPDVPEVFFGGISHTITGTSTTLAAGNYKDIILAENSILILESGTYNLRSLLLNNNATILFAGEITINAQWRLEGKDRVAILPTNNLTKPDDLTINYKGIPSLHEEHERGGNEDNDDDINLAWGEGDSARLVLFGDRSLLNFHLNAPRANVMIGKESVLLGQVVAGRIKMQRNSVVSRNESFSTEPDEMKIITDGNTKYLANEIILQLVDGTTLADAVVIANGVGGRVTGSLTELNLYKIEVQTTEGDALRLLVQEIIDAYDPLVSSATLNFIMDIQ